MILIIEYPPPYELHYSKADIEGIKKSIEY